jgi:hypothetical protein
MPIILWLLGVPLSVIILLLLFGFCTKGAGCRPSVAALRKNDEHRAKKDVRRRPSSSAEVFRYRAIPTGALLEVESILGIPDQFHLRMAGEGTRLVEVVRRQPSQIAVRFIYLRNMQKSLAVRSHPTDHFQAESSLRKHPYQRSGESLEDKQRWAGTVARPLRFLRIDRTRAKACQASSGSSSSG